MERSMGGQAGFGQGLPVGMAPLGGFPSSSGRDPLVGHTFSDSNSELNNHPGSSLLLMQEPVMTDEQVETLRRQISVYATICGQLVELHKSTMAHQANLLAGIQGGQRPPYDSGMAAQAFRSASRHRWTPSQVQLQILENLFEQGNGTPSKKQIKDITTELSQHGHISESNVYNWFQNRKARAKRKKQMLTPKDGDSDIDSDEDESTSEKRGRLDKNGQENQQMGLMNFEGNFSFSEQKSHMTNSTQEDHNTSNSYVVLIDGKPWEVPATVLDVKGSFGETATLLDSGMNIVPMDENGFSIQPLRAGENYILKRLDKNPRGVSTMKSEGIMNDNPSCTYFSLS